MKALMKKADGYDNMELLDIPEPKATGDLVKIKVEYAGICGSDLHAFHGTYSSTVTPVVLGHEFSGYVTEIGPKVTKVKVGDRVTSETTFATCGTCIPCKEKDYNLCSNRKGLGTQVNGAFAEYVLSREESVHIIPGGVSLLSAALSEPLACGVHASMEKTTIEKGDVCVVFGPGAIGLLLSQVAKAKGAYVILAGVSKDADRFEIATKIGIDMVVDQQKQDIVAIVGELTNNKGADKIFECSGAVAALNKGLEIAKKKADVVQMGVFSKHFNEINTEAILQKEIRYIGSRSQKPTSWQKTIQLLESGIVKPEEIVSLVVDLDHWREGFDKSLKAEVVKAVIKCSQ